MKSILLLLLAFPCISSKCQDSRLIEKVSFVPPDSLVQTIEKTVPDIESVLSSVNLYRITYLSDGLKVKGYLAVPKKQGNYPCIIYNRGGNKEYGKLTDKSFTRDLSEMSSKGYVIIASQYRGNDGGEGQEEFGGKDVNDVLNLIPLLSQVPSADTSRIGMLVGAEGA